MHILLDAMGGDNAPLSTVWGAALALESLHCPITLVGNRTMIEQVLRDKGYSALLDSALLTIVHTEDVVDMCDDPSTVLRHKPNSSMAVAFSMLKKGQGDALVSSGNTGALLTGATLYAGRIKGVRRAALAPFLPSATGNVMLCDAGANVECTPEMLVQFGVLASLYMQKISDLAQPRVGLVNNGSEPTKGDPLRREAYPLFEQAHRQGILHFVGNVEGKDVLLGGCDVAVCDGFSGNILLKTIEGTASFLAGHLRAMFEKNLATRLGYLTCRSGMNDLRALLNQDRVGGAPFIGVAKPVIKAHGSSNEQAICSAIGMAHRYAASGMIEAAQTAMQSAPKGAQHGHSLG